MISKYLNKIIMYHEIHKLHRLGFSNAKIARHLVVDSRTVGKILSLSEQEYEDFLSKNEQRAKKLAPYEDFVKGKLELYHDTSAAQIHDWLKENHPGLESVSPRTVFNFVMFVRRKYNIPVVKIPRQYFPVEQLPFGKQAQVDFGFYNLRTSEGKHKKVGFFVMVLSRSRMKYVWFNDTPFTAQSVCRAHEKAFAFFGGVPEEMVYDQDRTMLVDENLGELILTADFKQYIRSRNLNLHFCRKADPESKGKVENVVQYVKKNFLYNRVYTDIDTLNQQALQWLGRTANALPHNNTKTPPAEAFEQEKNHLKPFLPMSFESKMTHAYYVRKDNTISYKSNFYSLPQGTYQKQGITVKLREDDQGNLLIYNEGEVLLCSHKLAAGKGQTLINNNHRRDSSKSLEQKKQQMKVLFSNPSKAEEYILELKHRYPRYLRDHLQSIIDLLGKGAIKDSQAIADRTLDCCLTRRLYSSMDFKDVFSVFLTEGDKRGLKAQEEIKLLNPGALEKAQQTPEYSTLEAYEKLIGKF